MRAGDRAGDRGGAGKRSGGRSGDRAGAGKRRGRASGRLDGRTWASERAGAGKRGSRASRRLDGRTWASGRAPTGRPGARASGRLGGRTWSGGRATIRRPHFRASGMCTHHTTCSHADPPHSPSYHQPPPPPTARRDEWFYLIEFVCACHAIEAITPRSKVTAEMRAQLPDALLLQLSSPAFITSVMQSFDELDTDKSEKLERDELMPVVVDLIGGIGGEGPPPSADQCMEFVLMLFDTDGDTTIDRAEFVYLIEWCVVMNAIHAMQAKSQVTAEMRAKAPAGLMEHLASPAFIESTMASFDQLDVNKSEKLEAAELAPIIVDMVGHIDSSGPMDMEQVGERAGSAWWCRAVNACASSHTHTLYRPALPTPHHPQCMSFVGLVFDQDGDGTISRAEWYHLVEFVVVMNVLEAAKAANENQPSAVEDEADPPPNIRGPSLNGACGEMAP